MSFDILLFFKFNNSKASTVRIWWSSNFLNNLPYGLEYLEKRQSAEDFSQQYYNETF